MDAQQGSVGVTIVYQVLDSSGNPRDISSFTTHELVFCKPNETVLTRPATFQTTGVDGILSYTTVAGDLDPYGTSNHLLLKGGLEMVISGEGNLSYLGEIMLIGSVDGGNDDVAITFGPTFIVRGGLIF